MIFEFDNSIKAMYVCGDIHGEFDTLVHLICKKYQMNDCIVVIAGDCGFGFHKLGYYQNIDQHWNDLLEKHNVYILFVRGNHDNPAYFNYEATRFHTKHLICVPDYSIIRFNEHNTLCIGGGVSLDKMYRIKRKHYQESIPGDIIPNVYWIDEKPVYDSVLLKHITDDFPIHNIISHTAPSFCMKLQDIEDIKNNFIVDDELIEDIKNERVCMDLIYEQLKKDNMTNLSNWIYGHFHFSNRDYINGTKFVLLDINEFIELINVEQM